MKINVVRSSEKDKFATIREPIPVKLLRASVKSGYPCVQTSAIGLPVGDYEFTFRLRDGMIKRVRGGVRRRGATAYLNGLGDSSRAWNPLDGMPIVGQKLEVDLLSVSPVT